MGPVGGLVILIECGGTVQFQNFGTDLHEIWEIMSALSPVTETYSFSDFLDIRLDFQSASGLANVGVCHSFLYGNSTQPSFMCSEVVWVTFWVRF